MSFRNPPEIEPLDDLGWRRVEQGVFSQLALDEAVENPTGSFRSRWFLGGVVTTGLCVAALALWIVTSKSESSVAGGAEDSPTEDSPTAANSEPAVAPAAPVVSADAAQQIRTSRFVTAGDATTISLTDSALILQPDSAVVVNEGAGGTQLVLERGGVTCAVKPRPSDRPFRVVAGDTQVEVVGTKFSVVRKATGTTVAVERGKVRVSSDGQEVMLGAGDRWPKSETAVLRPELEKQDVVTKRAVTKSRVTKSAATKTNGTKAETPSKELYRQAARLESSDPRAASALYQKLSKRGGTWAKTALFARARLELERGNRKTAKRLLDQYLKRYPAALNSQDARALRRGLD